MESMIVFEKGSRHTLKNILYRTDVRSWTWWMECEFSGWQIKAGRDGLKFRVYS